jgi:transposase-like protein
MKPVVREQQSATVDALCCPHCLSERTVRWGTARGMRRRRCSSCKRTFNPLTKTPLARLRYKKRWLTFMGTVIENRSVRESAAACGVSTSTSARWHRRFLDCSHSERVRLLGAVAGGYSSIPALASSESGGVAEKLWWCRELLPMILSWIL